MDPNEKDPPRAPLTEGAPESITVEYEPLPPHLVGYRDNAEPPKAPLVIKRRWPRDTAPIYWFGAAVALAPLPFWPLIAEAAELGVWVWPLVIVQVGFALMVIKLALGQTLNTTDIRIDAEAMTKKSSPIPFSAHTLPTPSIRSCFAFTRRHDNIEYHFVRAHLGGETPSVTDTDTKEEAEFISATINAWLEDLRSDA